MEKHKVKQDSRAFQLVRIYVYCHGDNISITLIFTLDSFSFSVFLGIKACKCIYLFIYLVIDLFVLLAVQVVSNGPK